MERTEGLSRMSLQKVADGVSWCRTSLTPKEPRQTAWSPTKRQRLQATTYHRNSRRQTLRDRGEGRRASIQILVKETNNETPVRRCLLLRTATNSQASSSLSPPEILWSRSRRYCSTCMVRKTRWVVRYGRYKNRRCWKCFTPTERRAFREGY